MIAEDFTGKYSLRSGTLTKSYIPVKPEAICLLLYLLTGILLKKLKIFLIDIYNNFELSNQQYI